MSDYTIGKIQFATSPAKELDLELAERALVDIGELQVKCDRLAAENAELRVQRDEARKELSAWSNGAGAEVQRLRKVLHDMRSDLREMAERESGNSLYRHFYFRCDEALATTEGEK